MPGFGKAIQLDFDLRPNDSRPEDPTYVGIWKVITPTLLSGTQSMRFYYMGAGLNTIELKLFYDPDGKDEAFSYVRRESDSKDDWVKLEQLYSAFTPQGRKLIPENVRRLEIAVSHQLGGTPGPGRLVVDQIEVIQLFSPTPTPTHTPSPSPAPISVVVDTMDRLDGWRYFTDTVGSAINISSVEAKANNAVQIDFSLNPGGFVGISKAITPTLLSGTRGVRFFYKGAGPRATIELKLFYKPDASGKGEVFSHSLREIVGTDYWVPFEQGYSGFGCGDTCKTSGQTLDPAKVWKLEIAVSHQLGGTPGPGRIVLDQIEALR